MRIAVLSDIHGNLPALEAVLAATAPYDAIWQLGDVVGYGPQPDEVVARLVAEDARGVRGNHDSAALGLISSDAFNDDARAVVEWTAERIEPATRAWLTGLPETTELDQFTLVHGSPRDPAWEYVISLGVARANMAEFETAHCMVGHTHVPLVFRKADGQVDALRPTAGSSLALDGRRAIINPGSVGQPRDGDPRACAMVLDTERMRLEWYRVEYEIGMIQKLMRQIGLPPRLSTRLAFGL
jgi:predicted phosphodiesterase